MKSARPISIIFASMFVSAVVWPIAYAQDNAKVTIVKFQQVIDGTGQRLDGREIAIAEGRILEVGNALETDHSDAEIIDLRPLTAVPGLIDAHTHITYALAEEPKGDAWAELGATPRNVRLASAERNARAALSVGVTSIRDLNAGDGLDLYLRELIDNGVISGPRMFVSGQGLHPSIWSTRTGATRNLEAEILATAAEQVAEGADWIKMFGTSGSASDLTSNANFSDREIESAGLVARRLGVRFAVHSYGPEAVEGAIKAKAHSIEHAVGVDEKTFRKMAKADIIYVPTVDHNRYYADHRDEYGYGDEIEYNLRAFVTRNVDSVRLAHKAGVKIAMGSDALVTMFGQNTRELAWFVEAGMTPAEALQTATVNGAALLGREDDLGRLQEGFIADIVAVDGDLLTDIDDLITGVQWVMKDGAVVFDGRGGE